MDDFWGDAEWHSFETEMKRVLPERQWVELPMDHPIFHCVFDLKTTRTTCKCQTINFWRRGGITYRGRRGHGGYSCARLAGRQAADHGHRAHNTDNGDGWEREGEDADYFHTFSEARAYPLGINIIFYIMTH